MPTFRIWSDLHLDVGSYYDEWFEGGEAQYLILAGDITEITKTDRSMEFFKKCNDSFIRTFWLPGNHEYWKTYLSKWDVYPAQLLSHLPNVEVVPQCTAINVEGVLVNFATLWYHAPHLIGYPRDMLRDVWRDYKYIGVMTHRGYQSLNPHFVLGMHVEHATWFEKQADLGGTQLFVSHHPPIAPDGVVLSGDTRLYFNDDLKYEKFVGQTMVHGHVHDSLDYVKHGIRVACNPRGYEDYKEVNPEFDPQFTISLGND